MTLGKSLRKTPLWLVTLVGGIGIGACLVQRTGDSGRIDLTASANAAPAYSARDEPVVQAVQKAAPAVVTIDTTARVRIFEDQFDAFLGRGGRIAEQPTGAGSGVLLTGGYVLTNQHVVENAVESGGAFRSRFRMGDG